MTLRKKKILVIQSLLLIVGILILFFSYNYSNNNSKKIFTKKTKVEINKRLNKDKNDGSKFYDIEYSGLDLSGNRYILKAKEAINSTKSENLIILKSVTAYFYFKDNKILKISSKNGLYNNRNLNMIFENSVRGEYEGSTLFAEKAEYYNSKNLIIISNNVKVKDLRGTILAEKLIFDINESKLDISSALNKSINANINIK